LRLAPAPPRRPRRSLEYSILYTATLCLLAAGAVMVYSASSAESLLGGSGDPSYFLKRYALYAAIGLLALHLLSRGGLRLSLRVTPLLLVVGFALTALVLVPGAGVEVNGASRWLAAGPLRFQPSELLKVALVLYAARLLAARPQRLRTLSGLCQPLLLVAGAACALLLAQPDMGTAIVVCLAVGALMVAAGARLGHLGAIAAALAAVAFVVAWVEPYRRERLTAFLDPWADAAGSGFQSVQAMIAIGSGGLLGNGLGESVQKIFYLPEAHTDMILAIVGEEMGALGILALVALYGLLAYAGLRAAKGAHDREGQLVAAGITSLVLAQAVLNLFAVMGLAPLTGVPLPFISFGNSNMIVLLAAMGILLDVAGGGRAPARRGRMTLTRRGRGGDRARERDEPRPADWRVGTGERPAPRLPRARDFAREARRSGPERPPREHAGDARDDRRGRDGGTRRARARGRRGPSR
jgi:cell division protein FtsW